MTEEIKLHRVEFDVCALCLDGAGGECHVPGCAFWMHDAPTGETLEWLRGRRDWTALIEGDEPTDEELAEDREHETGHGPGR